MPAMVNEPVKDQKERFLFKHQKYSHVIVDIVVKYIH